MKSIQDFTNAQDYREYLIIYFAASLSSAYYANSKEIKDKAIEIVDQFVPKPKYVQPKLNLE